MPALPATRSCCGGTGRRTRRASSPSLRTTLAARIPRTPTRRLWRPPPTSIESRRATLTGSARDPAIDAPGPRTNRSRIPSSKRFRTWATSRTSPGCSPRTGRWTAPRGRQTCTASSWIGPCPSRSHCTSRTPTRIWRWRTTPARSWRRASPPAARTSGSRRGSSRACTSCGSLHARRARTPTCCATRGCSPRYRRSLETSPTAYRTGSRAGTWLAASRAAGPRTSTSGSPCAKRRRSTCWCGTRRPTPTCVWSTRTARCCARAGRAALPTS